MTERRPVVRLLVLTPDSIVLDTEVSSIRFQQGDGWRGVLPGHAPYISQLVNGILMYRLPGSEEPHYLVLYGGTLEVKRDMILILTIAAEHGAELQELAQRLLEQQAEADALALEAYIEFTKVRAALVKALTNLPPAPETIR